VAGRSRLDLGFYFTSRRVLQSWSLRQGGSRQLAGSPQARNASEQRNGSCAGRTGLSSAKSRVSSCVSGMVLFVSGFSKWACRVESKGGMSRRQWSSLGRSHSGEAFAGYDPSPSKRRQPYEQASHAALPLGKTPEPAPRRHALGTRPTSTCWTLCSLLESCLRCLGMRDRHWFEKASSA